VTWGDIDDNKAYDIFSTCKTVPSDTWRKYQGTLSAAGTAVSGTLNISATAWTTARNNIEFADIFIGRVIATHGFQIMGGTMGVYRYSFLPEDTENLAATSYYFDIWMRTPQNKEYTITVGTIQLLPVVGTM
jgi:hypothetical protein